MLVRKAGGNQGFVHFLFVRVLRYLMGDDDYEQQLQQGKAKNANVADT